MFWTILHRMILWELLKVFALSLLGITGILLMAGIVAEATQQGLSPVQVLYIIPLLIPSTLPYTIPATTLFATCVVYGRLAADNEILAVKAAGINVLHVVWPSLFLGLVMSLATSGLYYRIIPYTHSLLRSMFFNEVEESLYSVLRRDQKINEPRLNYAMWVRQVQGRKLLDALFKRRGPNGNYDIVARAREADLRVDLTRKLILLHMRNGTVQIEGGTIGYLDDRIWELPLPESINPDDRLRRPRELTWKEIGERRAAVLAVEEKLKADIALNEAKLLTNGAPEELHQHVANLKEKVHFLHYEVYALDAEKQMRPALAFGCLCFVLVGCPVGIWFGRSDYLSAFVTCFLPIVVVYYPLMLCGTNFAKDGKINPALTIWAADVLLLLVGLVMYRRLLKN